ncbi:O-antigen ligase family protein [Chitinophaga lutea]
MYTDRKILPLTIMILLCLLVVPTIAYVAASDFKMSAIVLGAVIGLSVAAICLLSWRTGYFILLVMVLSIRLVERVSGTELTIGVALDAFLGTILVGSIINDKSNQRVKVDFLRDPLLITYYVYILYLCLQCFNPDMLQRSGYGIFMRVMARNMIFIFLSIKMVRTMDDVRTFFKFWIGLSTVAAFYGCLQQWFGLMPFEKHYIALYPEKFKTVVILTGVRIFSFMSDPAVFGVLMACGIVMCIIFLTASTKSVRLWQKGLLLISAVLHAMALGYSGTRTGYVMVPMGLFIFFLANLHNRNTVITAVVFGMFAVLVLYGPFYGNATIVRVRTAFVGSSGDASLNVRDVNRHRIQPYIYKHPIGGGIMTAGEEGKAYNPGHALAGFPPDSGYLRVALEMGWIGLIIVCINIITGLSYAVGNYFRSRTEMDRMMHICIASVFFAYAVGQYAQEAAGLFESAFLFNALTGITIKSKYLLQAKTNESI